MKLMQRLIDKASHVPYTGDELRGLIEVIRRYWHEDEMDYNNPSGFDFLDLIEAINDHLKGRPIDINWGESTWVFGYEINTYKGLNLMQFLLVYYRKIFLLMACVPKEKLPLYLNKKPLKMVAEWRLKTGT